jgi:hypothetical protein
MSMKPAPPLAALMVTPVVMVILQGLSLHR